jgi:hypothetical protein
MARERVGRSASDMELVYRPRGRNGTPIKAAEEVRGKAQTRRKAQVARIGADVGSNVTFVAWVGVSECVERRRLGPRRARVIEDQCSVGNLHARLRSYFTFQAFPCATFLC